MKKNWNRKRIKIITRAVMPEIRLMNPLSDPIPRNKNIPPQQQPKINGSTATAIPSSNQAKNLDKKPALSIKYSPWTMSYCAISTKSHFTTNSPLPSKRSLPIRNLPVYEVCQHTKSASIRSLPAHEVCRVGPGVKVPPFLQSLEPSIKQILIHNRFSGPIFTHCHNKSDTHVIRTHVLYLRQLLLGIRYFLW